MRRIVVALVVALLAFGVVGCGGGGDEATTETPAADAAAAAPAAAAPAAPAVPEYTTDRSANDEDVPPAAFPSFTTTLTPFVFQEKLDAGRPMLVFFYDPAQLVTDDVRTEVDAVINEYRGLIDIVTFDVSGGGDATAAQTAVTYASELDVVGTPYTIIVDGGGFITWRWKGYVDRGIIGREVERATR